MQVRNLFALALLLALAGCGQQTLFSPDSGRSADAGVVDAGRPVRGGDNGDESIERTGAEGIRDDEC